MHYDTTFLIACGLLISGLLFCVAKISHLSKKSMLFSPKASSRYTWLIPNEGRFAIYGSGGTNDLKLLGFMDNGEWKPLK